MDNLTYFQAVDDLFDATETFLDEFINTHDDALDYERNGSVLTIFFENGSRMVMNTQAPLHQMWLATQKQGYHFEYRDHQWYCNRSGDTWMSIFMTSFEAQRSGQ